MARGFAPAPSQDVSDDDRIGEYGEPVHRLRRTRRLEGDGSRQAGPSPAATKASTPRFRQRPDRTRGRPQTRAFSPLTAPRVVPVHRPRARGSGSPSSSGRIERVDQPRGRRPCRPRPSRRPLFQWSSPRGSQRRRPDAISLHGQAATAAARGEHLAQELAGVGALDGGDVLRRARPRSARRRLAALGAEVDRSSRPA